MSSQKWCLTSGSTYTHSTHTLRHMYSRMHSMCTQFLFYVKFVNRHTQAPPSQKILIYTDNHGSRSVFEEMGENARVQIFRHTREASAAYKEARAEVLAFPSNSTSLIQPIGCKIRPTSQTKRVFKLTLQLV